MFKFYGRLNSALSEVQVNVGFPVMSKMTNDPWVHLLITPWFSQTQCCFSSCWMELE